MEFHYVERILEKNSSDVNERKFQKALQVIERIGGHGGH